MLIFSSIKIPRTVLEIFQIVEYIKILSALFFQSYFENQGGTFVPPLPTLVKDEKLRRYIMYYFSSFFIFSCEKNLQTPSGLINALLIPQRQKFRFQICTYPQRDVFLIELNSDFDLGGSIFPVICRTRVEFSRQKIGLF